MHKPDRIIKDLKLKPHPEGGFYRETYRSTGEIDQDDRESGLKGKRNLATCIYFLITSEAFSSFHRIRQDEIWHFYIGSPIRLHLITQAGDYSSHVIGNDIYNGEIPQIVVPGGNWFAAEVINNDDFSLVGCTVSPGFDYNDFELADQDDLLLKFPGRNEIIRKLTRK
jgi:uncharacterized protein